METHGGGTPSPSHSASADDHAPPFPPSSSSADTGDGALTSNDDLESNSARGADSDSEDAVVYDDEDDYDNDNDNDSSMRTFIAARLSNPPSAPRNTKLKTDNSNVKIENSDGNKDAAPVGTGAAAATGGSVPGIVVKEDATKIFTDNLQTSGAYSARKESLRKEEEAGRLKFVCYSNDGIDEHMIWLIGLKNIFGKQLPNMPKEYIVRLVMDRSHKSVMVIRRNHVVGGITYRPHASQKFGEIAFCAITADEQVKGYGTRLMNHLKQHARDKDGLTHFLTYADNHAVGYFIKQGFTKEIHLEKDRWQGYIKDYDGGILMECEIDPKLPYTELSPMIRRQRQAIDESIRELSSCYIVYTGIDFQKKEAGIPKKIIEDIPGLREAGWTPDQWGHSGFRTLSGSTESLNAFMRFLLKSMHDHADAWPFREPVDARDVPDYYDIIKDPIGLKLTFNWLVAFSLVMIVIGRFIINFFLLEIGAWLLFIFLETYTRMFWSAESLYYNPVLHFIVATWETLVYSPILDLDRWAIPLGIILSFFILYWRFYGKRKHGSR